MNSNPQPQTLPRYQDMGLFDESFYQVSDPSRPDSMAISARPVRTTRNVDSVSTESSAMQSSSAASSDYHLPTSLYEFREQSQGFEPTVAAAPTVIGHQSRNFFDSATAASPHDSVFGDMTAAEIEEVDRAYGLESLLQLVEMGFPAKHGRIALKQTKGHVPRAITFCIEHDAQQMEQYILADARGEVIGAPEPVNVVSTNSPNALPPPQAAAQTGKAKGAKGGVSGLLRSVFKKSGTSQPASPSGAVAGQQQQFVRAAPAPVTIAAPPPSQSSASAAVNTFRLPAMNPSFVAGNNSPRVVPQPPARRSNATDVLTTVQEPEWEDFHLFPELASPSTSMQVTSASQANDNDSSAVTVVPAPVAAPSVTVTIEAASAATTTPPPAISIQLHGLESSSSEYGSFRGDSLSLSTAANESRSNNTPHISIATASLDHSRVASFILADSPARGAGDVFDEPFARSSSMTIPLPPEEDDEANAIPTITEEDEEPPDEVEEEAPPMMTTSEAEGELNTFHSTSFIIEGEATIVSAAFVVPSPPVETVTAVVYNETAERSLNLASTSDGNDGLSFSEFASPDPNWASSTAAPATNNGVAVDASFDANIFDSYDPFVVTRQLPQLPPIELSMPAEAVQEEEASADDNEIEEDSFNDDTNSSITSLTAAVTTTVAAASAPPRPPSTTVAAAVPSSLPMLDLSEEEEAFIRDGHISIHANNIITDFTAPVTPFPRRKLSAYFIDQLPSGLYRAIVVLKQVKLKPNESSPQGNRADQIILSDCHTQQMAQDLCEVFAPPVWSGKHEEKDCSLCKTKFSMFSAPHHCRNCGHLVCNSCSDKLWPGHMLPRTYHNNEKIVRVCHSCHFLLENFIVALREGDFNKAQSIYSSGNINLHQPYAAYMASAHAVHLAAGGGNLNLLKWLIDQKRCPIVEKTTKLPIATQSGLSVLAIAAQAGHAEIIRYLVHEKGCLVTEIQDVLALQRALHALLEAPGPLPTNDTNAKGMCDDLLFPLPAKNAAPASVTTAAASAVASPSSPTPNAAWTSATAREAPILMMNSNVYAAPAFVNTMGVVASPDLPLNGLTNSTLAKQARYRFLASQAVFMVNEFLETQRRALMYTVPVSRAAAAGPTSPTPAATVRIAMASAVPVTATNAVREDENVNIVTVEAVPARGGR